MAENINISMKLMFRNDEVAEININISDQWLSVNSFDITNSSLLPHMLRVDQKNVKDWMMSRLMPSNTRHYISMMPIIFRKGTNRRPFAQFLLSLETNGVCFSDHYWFKPEYDLTIYCEERVINFKNNEWNKINSYKNDIWSFELNEFLFHDMLFSYPDDMLPSFNNPIFTTNGFKEKMWYRENETWILEKRLSHEQLKKEIECFSFCKTHGLLTPEYETVHHNVIDRYQFQPHTIRKGFHTIKKKCLTSQTKQIVPLNWYISEVCEDNIHSLLEQTKKMIQIDGKTLKVFEDTIVEYMSRYDYKQLASSNLGFLIDVKDNAAPAVWSNMGYIENNPFIKELQF